MNYILEIGEYTIKRIVYQKSNKLTLKTMLNYFEVSNKSYFSYFFNRLYSELFEHGNNLYGEYKKYYKKEFSTYSIFLQRKYNLLESELKRFTNIKKIVYKGFNNSSDHVINTLCDEEFRKSFLKYLEYVYED